MAFKKAERSQIKLKLAIEGPSGSGKTFTSLLIATGFIEAAQLAGEKAGRIAVIDTENETSAVYSEFFDFDVQPVKPPFTVKAYMTAIQEAIAAGYEMLVIDSISHEWSGKGGLLEQKEILDATGKGNSYTNWGTITKQHNAFIEAIVQAPIHIIVTMRSKQDYILTEGSNASGKAVTKPQKVGLAPVQREGTEYEFYTVLSMSMNHAASCSKDRTGLFDGREGWVPNKETGAELREFLRKGKPLEMVRPTEEGKMETVHTPAPAHAPLLETENEGLDAWKEQIYNSGSVAVLEQLRAESIKVLDPAGQKFLKPHFEQALLMLNKKKAQPATATAPTEERLEMIKASIRDCDTEKDLNAVMKTLKEHERNLVHETYTKRIADIKKHAVAS